MAVIFNNGRRLKLAPHAAHRYLKEGWARIPEDDPESRQAYERWLAGQDVSVESSPAPELPDGYAIEKSASWYVVTDPNGYQVGKGKRSREDALALAIEDAQVC